MIERQLDVKCCSDVNQMLWLPVAGFWLLVAGALTAILWRGPKKRTVDTTVAGNREFGFGWVRRVAFSKLVIFARPKDQVEPSSASRLAWSMAQHQSSAPSLTRSIMFSEAIIWVAMIVNARERHGENLANENEI